MGTVMAKPSDGKTTEPVVYVVDDDDGMRRALHTLLSTIGYKTAVFSRPSEFLATFKTDAAGCLVLDIRMPDMSGLELQQHLNRMGSMLLQRSEEHTSELQSPGDVVCRLLP